MAPIKILHVVGSMDKGGVQSFLMEVLRNTDPTQIQFFFLCDENESNGYEDEIHNLGGKILTVPSLTDSGPFKYVRNVQRIIQENGIQALHAHIYLASVFSLFAAKWKKIPIRIAHSHSSRDESNASLSRRFYITFSKMLINKLTSLNLSCGESAGKSLFGDNHFFPVKNGIAIEQFAFDNKKRAEIRQELGIDDEVTVLLHVGRFIGVKNHQFLLKIFEKYLANDAEAKLVLVGDGPLLSEIKQAVSDLGIDKSVLFLGVRDDVKFIYSIGDLLLLPSISEGFPLTLLEAQANGLPSLVSTGVPSEVNLHKEIVQFKPLSDSLDSWVVAIKARVRNRDETARISLQRAGYDSAASARALHTIYESAFK